MNRDWQKDPRSLTPSATFLPPATVDEAPWDILLAVHSDRRCELGLHKLARMVSVSQPVLIRWLERLEERRLIASVWHGAGREIRTVLTPACRQLLDRYLSATSDLQVGAHFEHIWH